jgi:hypothetical protein
MSYIYVWYYDRSNFGRWACSNMWSVSNLLSVHHFYEVVMLSPVMRYWCMNKNEHIQAKAKVKRSLCLTKYHAMKHSLFN